MSLIGTVKFNITLKGHKMITSYKGLWKILIDRNLQKKDLINAVGVSSSTIAKMGKGENVSLDVLERLCAYFDCNIGDVVSFEKENAVIERQEE